MACTPGLERKNNIMSKQVHINNNTIDASQLSISGKGILPVKAVLKGIRVSYATINGKKTDKIEAVRYDLVNPENFDTFTVKVPGKSPIIEPEEFEKEDKIRYICLPVSDILVKPYSIEYGKAKVTIVAPAVTLEKTE